MTYYRVFISLVSSENAQEEKVWLLKRRKCELRQHELGRAINNVATYFRNDVKRGDVNWRTVLLYLNSLHHRIPHRILKYMYHQIVQQVYCHLNWFDVLLHKEHLRSTAHVLMLAVILVSPRMF